MLKTIDIQGVMIPSSGGCTTIMTPSELSIPEALDRLASAITRHETHAEGITNLKQLLREAGALDE